VTYDFDYSKITVMDYVMMGSQYARDNPMLIMAIIDKCSGGSIAGRHFSETEEIVKQFSAGLQLYHSDAMSQIADNAPANNQRLDI
jgi:hypothetical protein